MRMVHLKYVVLIILLISAIAPMILINPGSEQHSIDIVTFNKDTKEFSDNNILNTRGIVEGDTAGGSFLDSFVDSSDIDLSNSDRLNVTSGDVKILIDDLKPFNVDANTIALWHMDEGTSDNVDDSSTNYNNGTFNQTPSWTTGKFGKGLYFDGGGQFYRGDSVNVTDSNSLNISGHFTIEAWIKAKGDQGYSCIIDKYEYNGNLVQEFGYTLYLVEGMLRFSVYSGPLGGIQAQSKTDLRDNRWHHVAGTYDGTYLHVYVDGVEEEKADCTNPPASTSNNLGIGLRLYGYGGYMPFYGTMDEVRISDTARPPLPVKRSANLTSKSITLPAGQHWDTLVINKTQQINSYASVTILDASTNQPIPGSLTYLDDGEFDISYIDSAKYPSIKLKAAFEGNNWGLTPVIHYWGVSWNASHVWRDSFFAGHKIAGNGHVDIMDGEVRFNNFDTLTSTPIKIPDTSNKNTYYHFDSLEWSTSSPPGSDLRITILDHNDDIISGFSDLLSRTIDLRLIDPMEYPEIKLKAICSPTSTNITLYDWSINMVKNTVPEIISFTKTSSVALRTESVGISIDLSDVEELEQDLIPQVNYKAPSNTTWQDDYLSKPSYETDHWEYTFTPPAEAELGYYSFRCIVNDSFYDYDNITESEFIKVLNNIPSITNIQTNTSEFSVYRTQTLEIIFNATDVEIPTDELDVRIYHKSPTDLLWRKNLFSDLELSGSTFKTIFAPLKDDDVGWYQINITCDDSDDIVIEEYGIWVLNNVPTKPTVEITPTTPNLDDDLTVTAGGSVDIETPEKDIVYWYRWYRNDTHVPKYDNRTTIPNDAITAGDSWWCFAAAFDGEGTGPAGEAVVRIYNPAVDDFDNDSVPDLQDAFPADPAASVDTDGDGSPDSWNPGKSENDSTTPLHLDAFPKDPAASIDSDGDGYPDKWNDGKTVDDSTEELKLDDYPEDPTKHTKVISEPEGQLSNFFVLAIIAVVILIVLLTIALLIVRSKRQRKRFVDSFYDDKRKRGMGDYNKTLKNVRSEIAEGKTIDYSNLTSTETKATLTKKLQSGEMSSESYDYIQSMLDDTEDTYHSQKSDLEDISRDSKQS